MTLEENLDSVSPMLTVYVAAMDKRGYERLMVDGVPACEVVDVCVEQGCSWLVLSEVLEFIEYPLPDGSAAIRFRVEDHSNLR